MVDIPVFWNFDIGSGEANRPGRDDGTEALQWLRGTEVAKTMNTLTEDNKSLIVRMVYKYFAVNAKSSAGRIKGLLSRSRGTLHSPSQ